MKKILPLLIVIVLSSCATNKGGDVRIFFIDKGKLQYFIPSGKWNERSSDLKIEADWLYRTYPLEEEQESRTILNLTLFFDDPTVLSFPLENLALQDQTTTLRVRDVEVLFRDNNRIRFTSWLSSEDFFNFMIGTTNPFLTLTLDDTSYLFDPGDSFNKHILYFKQVRPGFSLQ